MLWLIKEVFVALFSFFRSLVRRYVTLNNKLCMARPTLIDLNPVDLNYYAFMISSDKCNENCNVLDDLSTKICVTKIKDAKTLVRYI